jgi:TolB protein
MRASRVILISALGGAVLAALTVGCRSRSGGTAADHPAPSSSPAAAPAEAPSSSPSQELTRELAGAGGEILFLSERDGALALYRMAPDGTGVARVAAPSGATLFPAAGRARLAIATSGGEDAHSEQLAIAGDGGAWKRLGPVAGKIRNPSAAPDRSWIAFESDAASFRDIYRVDVATGKVARLTDDGDGAFEPVVAPDGRRIAFVTTVTGDPQVHVMDPDGKQRSRLVDLGVEHSPAWAPDATRLALVSGRDGPERIFVVAADGTGLRRLSARDDAERHEVAPRWSPDGTRIAYELHSATGTRELWVTDAAGGRATRLSKADAHVDMAAWSPDGRYLVFADDGDDGSQLFVARADGSAVVQLTRDPTGSWLPRWRD